MSGNRRDTGKLHDPCRGRRPRRPTGKEGYVLPKYYIIIALIIVIVIVSVIRIARKSSSHHFECPDCGEHFQVSFSKSFFTAHSLGGSYSVKCPKCGKTNALPPLDGRS